MFTLQTGFKPLLPGGRGVKSVTRGDCEWQGGKLLKFLSQMSKNSVSREENGAFAPLLYSQQTQ